MISGLRGRVHRFGPSRVHLDTGGVVYEVHIPLNVFDVLQGSAGQDEIFLHVHHQFMQDEERLFGFLDPSSRDFFAALITVKGLGSGLALSVLSHLDGLTLLDLCEKNDIPSLTKIPRVGKATAESLAFEINRKKDRFRKLLADSDRVVSKDEPVGSEELELAYQALLQLGYKENQIRVALEKARLEPGFQEIASMVIRDALKYL